MHKVLKSKVPEHRIYGAFRITAGILLSVEPMRIICITYKHLAAVIINVKDSEFLDVIQVRDI